MQSVRVNLGNRSYEIRVGSGILSRLGEWCRASGLDGDPFLISNPTVMRCCREPVDVSLRAAGYKPHYHAVPDTERSKSLAVTRSSLRKLARFDFRKKTFIIALGGGVVGDLAGFVASVYKRGIPYVQVPTTLLAQVDSAIGGKTAVDLPEGKNLVGSFYQPKLVVSDVACIATLEERQVRAGLAEVIKYAAVFDASFFSWLEENIGRLLNRDQESLGYAVEISSAIKAQVVSADERDETGRRMLLNFGHTIGHAIEAAGRYRRYNHGEAIALGMLVACEISARVLKADGAVGARLKELIRRAGLPLEARGISSERVLQAHYRDKKFIGERNRFVLLRSVGRADVQEDIPLDIVTQSLKVIFP